MSDNISAVAVQVTKGRYTGKPRLRKPYGICLHTTGSGVPCKALKRKQTAKDVAIDVYLGKQNGADGYKWGGPGYIIDYDGTIYQIADDNVRTEHCGGHYRSKYLLGTWVDEAPAVTVELWKARWGAKYKSPQHLFPHESPNDDYIGVEMIPVAPKLAKPWREGLKFTEAQHVAAKGLCNEIAARNFFPPEWWLTGRLVGHEDIQPVYWKPDGPTPFGRSDKGGGWDPGFLRKAPYFDFKYLLA